MPPCSGRDGDPRADGSVSRRGARRFRLPSPRHPGGVDVGRDGRRGDPRRLRPLAAAAAPACRCRDAGLGRHHGRRHHAGGACRGDALSGKPRASGPGGCRRHRGVDAVAHPRRRLAARRRAPRLGAGRALDRPCHRGRAEGVGRRDRGRAVDPAVRADRAPAEPRRLPRRRRAGKPPSGRGHAARKPGRARGDPRRRAGARPRAGAPAVRGADPPRRDARQRDPARDRLRAGRGAAAARRRRAGADRRLHRRALPHPRAHVAAPCAAGGARLARAEHRRRHEPRGGGLRRSPASGCRRRSSPSRRAGSRP